MCSEILPAAELEGWLAETSTGVVLPSVSAWFRWLTRSDLIASAWMPRVQGPGLVFGVARHPVYQDSVGTHGGSSLCRLMNRIRNQLST